MTLMSNESVAFADKPMAAMAIAMSMMAQGSISGVKVGAAVKARNKDGVERIFGGCNIEISVGCQANIHAERLAMLKAISEGYTTILECFISSNKDSHSAAMCGYCMQDFTYLNPHCRIVVVRPDFTWKIDTTVKVRQGDYPYISKGKIQ